jgi:3'-phosphoadenosine 5'-phosphosulfate sulfotransferase (PAPS reductase)/FAD synthetase
VLSYHAVAGLPADIVPVEADATFAPYLTEKPAQVLQPYTRCCAAMLWQPMAAAVKASGVNVVLRGSKRSDARVGSPDGFIEDGVRYTSPLWTWTDADVAAYLDHEGVALPAHYAAGVRDSLDCARCSAHLAHHGAAKLRWMRNNEPELFRQVSERHRRVQAALAEAHQQIAGAYAELETI